MNLLLVLYGCGSDVAVGVPWLEVPENVLFDEAQVGIVNILEVAVLNSGTASATVSASATSPFDVTLTDDQLIIEAHQTGLIPILLKVDSYDKIQGVLTVKTATESREVTLTLVPDIDVDDDGDPAIAAGGTDCDDVDPSRNGAASEICNGIDDDCNDLIDDDVIELFESWPDADGDGFGDGTAEPALGCSPPDGFVADDTDCDDTSDNSYPGAPETWYNNVDEACDGGDDFDCDGDSFASDDYGGDDCDDADALIFPTADEIWYDGTDQNCDGNDDDQDGDGDSVDIDCDDTDALSGPSAPELDDGYDQDCDGLVDEGLFAPGTLLLTEILADPSAVADNVGRYIELYNPTDGHVELDTVTVRVGGNTVPMPAVILAPGSPFVMCVELDDTVNGGITCNHSLVWTGSVEEIEIRGGSPDILLDLVDWQPWASPTSGVAWELSEVYLDDEDNDNETSWCLANDMYGTGDLGSPGTTLGQCL